MRRLLRIAGIQADTYSTADAALASLEAGQRYDAIVLDLLLGNGESGIDLAARVQELAPSTPIGFCSGFSDDPRLRATKRSLLSKPFGNDALVRFVRRLVTS